MRFVRATADGSGSQMGREFPWDAEHASDPELALEAARLPPGSDERDSSKSDSALSVYAVFGQSSVATRAVKYIWSRVVPVGTTLGSSRARAIVLRSGAPPDGVGDRDRQRAAGLRAPLRRGPGARRAASRC